MLFSIDLETDGLYGPAFAAAAIVYDDDGRELDRFTGRCLDDLVTNEWVRENVLPAISSMEVTHVTSEALEEALWAFWRKWAAKGAVPLAHCASPVETGFFRRAVERDLPARKWQGPYPAIIEVATALMVVGANPSSVDEYARDHGLSVPDGTSHDPAYDASVAHLVWRHVMGRVSAQ